MTVWQRGGGHCVTVSFSGAGENTKEGSLCQKRAPLIVSITLLTRGTTHPFSSVGNAGRPVLVELCVSRRGEPTWPEVGLGTSSQLRQGEFAHAVPRFNRLPWYTSPFSLKYMSIFDLAILLCKIMLEIYKYRRSFIIYILAHVPKRNTFL